MPIGSYSKPGLAIFFEYSAPPVLRRDLAPRNYPRLQIHPAIAVLMPHSHGDTSKAPDAWAYWNHVELDFSRPGKPADNAFVESFNATVRRECLSQH
jgi:transposase InsO family protein